MKIKDQLNREVNFPGIPGRIVSVVPSQTELLYDLGLEDKIAGITKFCVHPEKIFRSKPRVGGTRQLNIDKIKQLNPDLIIANKEENTKSQLEELMQHCPVWISDIKNLNDALDMILAVGEITATTAKAKVITQTISNKFEELAGSIPTNKKSAAYFIWQNPYMCAGGDTFINDLMHRCGVQNVFSNKLRYPETTNEELNNINPDLILLSSEPFPFKEKHRQHMQHQFPQSRIVLVDGEMFSWYGSRLIHAADYLRGFSRQYLS